MTGPVAPTGTAKLGPGTLTIGAVGDEIDVSCLVNNLVIACSKDQEEPTTKLCGTTRQGAITYTYEMDGNLDTDVATSSGLFALSQSAAGTEQPYTFTPSTEAGTTATGTLVIDPMDFGTTDDYGSDLTSDIAWALTGQPVYTYGDDEPVSNDPTSATAGTPGSFLPAGSDVPADLDALQAIDPPVTADPDTAWTEGQSVDLGTGSAYWDGDDWQSGTAPGE